MVASHVDVRRSQNYTDPSWSETWTCSGNLTLKVFQRRKWVLLINVSTCVGAGKSISGH